MSTTVLQQWLASQCALIPGVRSAVLTLQPPGGGAAAQAIGWPARPQGLQRLLAATRTALQRGQPLIQLRPAGGEAQSPAQLVATPVRVEGLPPAAAALCLEGSDPQAGRRALALLDKGLPWLREQLARAEARPGAPAAGLDPLAGELLAAVLSADGPAAAATALTTRLAAALDCERVSLAARDGLHTRLLAVSHSARVKPRQAAAEAFLPLFDEAMDQAATLRWPPPEDGPPRITVAHRQFAAAHHDAALCTVPLAADGRVTGALLLERPAGRPFTDDEVQRLEAVARLLAPVLDLQRQAHRSLAGRLRRGLAGLWRRLRDPAERRSKLVAAVVVGLLLALTFVQLPWRIASPARVEGAVQRVLAAPLDGYIEAVHVRPGDHVRKGQLLVRLEDRDLRLEKRRLEGELAGQRSDYGAALAGKDRTRLAVAVARSQALQARLALVEQQLARTRLAAPFDGVVLEGDLSQSLGAPVHQGDPLLTVAPDGRVRIMLAVDERDIDAVAPGLRGRLVLTARPGQALPLRVTRVTPMAQVVDGRNVFMVEATLDGAPPQALRPGLEGVARLDAGRRALGWLLAHRAVDWLRFQWWRWTGT